MSKNLDYRETIQASFTSLKPQVVICLGHSAAKGASSIVIYKAMLWLRLPATESASVDETLGMNCQKAAALIGLEFGATA